MRHQNKLARKAELEKERQEKARFQGYMKSQGWIPKVYFMRGFGWDRGNERILIDHNGIHMNGQVVTREELRQYVQYKQQKQ